MPLTSDYRSVKDWETVCVTPDGYVETITERIIWGTMMTGLPEVKAENLDEWVIRITMLNKVQPKTLEVNLNDLQQRIGLRTNARSYTPAKFRKIIINALLDEGQGEYRRQRESMKRFNLTEGGEE